MAHIIHVYLYLQPKQKFKLSSCIRQQFSTAVRSTAHLELKLCPIYNHKNLLLRTCFVPTKKTIIIRYLLVLLILGCSWAAMVLCHKENITYTRGPEQLYTEMSFFSQNKIGIVLKLCSSIFRLADSLESPSWFKPTWAKLAQIFYFW